LLPNHGLRCVNLHLERISNNDGSFVGKVDVVGGDFRQTLPVIPKGNRATIIESTVKSNILLSEFKKLSLLVNMRTNGYQPHYEWLLSVGSGSILHKGHLKLAKLKFQEIFYHLEIQFLKFTAIIFKVIPLRICHGKLFLHQPIKKH
jgi:PIF1-like helicase